MFLRRQPILIPDAPMRNRTPLSSISEHSSFSEHSAFGGTLAKGLVQSLRLQCLILASWYTSSGSLEVIIVKVCTTS